MTKQTFDPVRYKAAQRIDWSTAAEGWRKWWRTIEDGLGPIAERLVELAALERGDRVLDVATGIGEPAVTAARRVGPEGRVVATDIAPGMLDIGRERAAELGLDNVEFREADAEELELPDEQFDAVLSRNGLMFFPDLPAALERMRAVLVGGGRLAAAVWGRPEQTPFIAVTHRTVARELGLPPPAPGTPGPLSLSDADALESRLRQAGFADVRSEGMTISVDFDSAEAYVEFTRAVSVPLKNLLEGESTERKEEVWSAVASSAREYAAGDGSLSLPGEVICVVGLAPGR